ncbi:hypothetical protein N7462_007135 [Penicillium macrosclerotiorum]|uniref:uncharacterized protein n=1 Tax=Penicillium macrosclerotiorum TaxID=303699 RepID=UPI0025467988|nr:uncharacterized protein N7462_007135 [Penicillium macrosclerotiorum]KAJ5678891.1 hypothetical protein N7462_007135 [Penicillium macrosclerotiorum]
MALEEHKMIPPKPSALTQLIESVSASENPFAATTIQVLHNLQHQHLWTSLQVHELDAASATNGLSMLISGISPHRVYTHPDEQLYMLEQGIREDDLPAERLFVVPTAHGQTWSLSRMAAVFDALPRAETSSSEDSSLTYRAEDPEDPEKAKKLEAYNKRREQAQATNEWGSRRVLLAMVDRNMGGEGTVVYYVVQEGEVKPRQN